MKVPTGVRFREAELTDAAALLALMRSLDLETSSMLLEPDERTEDEHDIAADLAATAAADNSVVMLAQADGRLIGYAGARGGRFRRRAATAQVVIGVLATASGRGVGSGLLRELDLWAPGHGVHRLELTVMAHNERAAALYQRVGYIVEGRARESLFVDGRLVDELYMAKLFPPS
jgi:RimJ/RimL family protein N-acetyltransferase